MPTFKQLCGRIFRPAVAALTLFLLAGVVQQSETFAECIKSHKNTKDYQQLRERIGVLGGAIVRIRTRLRLNYVCAWAFAGNNNGAIFAAALTVVSWLQWRTYRAQANIMESQLQAAISASNAAQSGADAAKQSAEFTRRSIVASQRAWLTVQVSLVKGQEFVIFNQDGAVLPIRLDLRNIGNFPAIKVSWHAWLIFEGGGPNALQEQSFRCEKIRQQYFGIGPTIFPQECYPAADTDWSFGAGASWEEINRVLGWQERRRIVGVSLVGCVDYTFLTDPDAHHQTGFIYYLRMPSDSTVPEINDQSGNVAVPVHGLVKADFILGPAAD